MCHLCMGASQQRGQFTSHTSVVLRQWFQSFLAWGHSYFVGGRQRPQRNF